MSGNARCKALQLKAASLVPVTLHRTRRKPSTGPRVARGSACSRPSTNSRDFSTISQEVQRGQGLSVNMKASCPIRNHAGVVRAGGGRGREAGRPSRIFHFISLSLSLSLCLSLSLSTHTHTNTHTHLPEQGCRSCKRETLAN